MTDQDLHSAAYVADGIIQKHCEVRQPRIKPLRVMDILVLIAMRRHEAQSHFDCTCAAVATLAGGAQKAHPGGLAAGIGDTGDWHSTSMNGHGAT